MTQDALNEIVRLHKLRLIGDPAGKKADLRGSDLRGSDLRGSDLRGSDLRGSDLSDSDLRGSDLRGSDLRDSANVVSISGIGSFRRMTTFREDTDEIWCGCFKGTLAEFDKKVKETHKGNPDHLAHYLAAVAFFKEYKKNVKPIEKKQQRACNEQSH